MKLKIKPQLFQFSDTDLENFDQCPLFVFIMGHCHQILWTVIISNPIKMMDYPSFGNWSIMRFFPNKNMLFNIATIISPVMVWFQDVYITPASPDTPTFPMGCLFSNPSFIMTGLTFDGSFCIHKFPTYRTRFLILFPQSCLSYFLIILFIIFPLILHTLYYTMNIIKYQLIGSRFHDIREVER